MISCLKDLKVVLNKYRIPFWLEHGTLLGYVREGKLISGDDDIDLSAFYVDFLNKHEKASKDLYNLGYDIYITRDKMTIKKKDKHATLYLHHLNKEHITRNRISKKNFKANILLYGFLEGLSTPCKDSIHSYTPKTKFIQMLKRFMMSVPSKKGLYNLILAFGKKIDCLVSYDVNIPASYISTFKEITFYNMKLFIPGEPEKYLEHMYGKNWKIPDENWHPWKSFYKLMLEYNTKKDLLPRLDEVIDGKNNDTDGGQKDK